MLKALQSISIFWLALICIILASIFPLLIYVITDQAMIALVSLIVMSVGSAYLLTSISRSGVNQLTHVSNKIEQNIVEHNQMPDVDNLLTGVGGVREIADLTSSLRTTLRSLDRQINQANSLYSISQTIMSSTLDYEKTVQAVLSAVQKVVDYDAAEVSVLYDDHLVVEAWWGKDGFKDTTGRKYQVGTGLTGNIAKTQEIVYMPEVGESAEIQRTIGYASVETEFLLKTTKLVINSFLGIPLNIGDRLIGTLTLVHHKKGFFTEEDKRQLDKLEDQASIAIDNALKIRQREKQLQNQIDVLRDAVDTTERVSQVKEITESEYFQQLQARALKMRERSYRRTGQYPAVKPGDLPTPPTE